MSYSPTDFPQYIEKGMPVVGYATAPPGTSLEDMVRLSDQGCSLGSQIDSLIKDLNVPKLLARALKEDDAALGAASLRIMAELVGLAADLDDVVGTRLVERRRGVIANIEDTVHRSAAVAKAYGQVAK